MTMFVACSIVPLAKNPSKDSCYEEASWNKHNIQNLKLEVYEE